ncbi:MAG: carbohydrate ABC transporter permease [Chloroflexi bacterium]|nr:carbohydrate ABC transporter permease [Chloroflexota bacterium]
MAVTSRDLHKRPFVGSIRLAPSWIWAVYGVLGFVALLTLLPFYWEFMLSSHTTSDIASTPPPFFLGGYLLENYSNMMEYIPYFWRSMLNSFIIAAPTTVVTIFFSALGGYAFARYRFPAKEKLFWLLLATMMIPGQLGLIPWYIQMTWMGWTNTFWPFIVPAIGNAFGVFWMRQYIASAVPSELFDAARIDGASEFGMFWRIALPLAAPAAAAMGITTFIGGWNSFLGPLVIMQSPDMYTYAVALANLRGVHGTDTGALLLGSSIATIPMLIVTIVGSRKIIDGLTAGALSGQ